jgi:hypothetical protein
MAQFRGTVQGGRSEASRLGHKNTGLTTTTNGWSGGVKVEAIYRQDFDADVFHIYATSGSGNYNNPDGYVGTVIDGKWYTPKQYNRYVEKRREKTNV